MSTKEYSVTVTPDSEKEQFTVSTCDCRACRLMHMAQTEWDTFTPRTVISALRGSGGTVLIQIDRPIDPANSGSPFVTAQGAVVGIASYKMGQEDDSAGFAVSVKELKPFLSAQ